MDTWIHGEIDRQADRQVDWQTGSQTHRQKLFFCRQKLLLRETLTQKHFSHKGAVDTRTLAQGRFDTKKL